jgi:glucan endo-1,3-alpha-glucosidase
MFNNRAFVSTFAGENCNFGRGNVIDGWTAEFVQHPDLAGKIHFVPSFFVDPNRFGDFRAVMDGAFAWDSGWPQKVDKQFTQQQLGKNLQNNPSISPALRVVNRILAPANQQLAIVVIKTLQDELKAVLSPAQRAVSSFIGDTDLDSQFLRGLNILHGQLRKRDPSGASKPTYMAAVAANFFTHYGPDTFNKNVSCSFPSATLFSFVHQFAYLGDQHLLAKRWEAIISNRDQYDIIQILTWNDYGESHYVGPIKGALPNSEAWTIGFNHTAFLDVHKFYAEAFKTGTFPEITEDRLVIWSRPHAALATASDDRVGPPKNFDLFQDNVWALAITSAPGKVTLETSPTNSKSFDVLRGVTKLAIRISPGDTMKGSIERNGQKVVEVTAPGFTFQGNPNTFNYNYFVAGAGSKDRSSPPSPLLHPRPLNHRRTIAS